jgi:hypothetical protein
MKPGSSIDPGKPARAWVRNGAIVIELETGRLVCADCHQSGSDRGWYRIAPCAPTSRGAATGKSVEGFAVPIVVTGRGQDPTDRAGICGARRDVISGFGAVMLADTRWAVVTGDWDVSAVCFVDYAEARGWMW